MRFRLGHGGGTYGQAAASDDAVPEFSAVDADKDGVISSSEAVAVPALVEQFSEADRNADGQLTKDEYADIERGGEDKPSEGRI